MERGPQHCILIFNADDGSAFALDNYGDFFWGDRVYVTGPINVFATTCWPLALDAIEDNTIAACDE